MRDVTLNNAPAAGTAIRAFTPGIRMRRWLARSLSIIVAFGVSGACDARVKACSPREAAAADAAIDGLDSWTKLERAHKQYGHCDDGSIAQGHSEAVARLLVDHWSTLALLAELAQRDPAFKRFVLRHIDATLDTDDLDKIGTLAAAQCPPGSTPLCRELLHTAARAATQ